MLKAKKYSFDIPYNWEYIDNIFNNEDARYYVIDTDIWTYLQYYKPFVKWFEMITDDNFEDVSNEHISNIEKNILNQKELLRKNNIIASLISTPDLSSVDLEWVTFTNKEIGDIILERVFGGNPHAESALLAKTNTYILSLLSWEPDEELLDSIIEKQNKINEVRQKFNLKVI